MVSVLDSGSHGGSPSLGHGVALYSQSASLHPGVHMVTCKLNMGITLQWTRISQGRVEILLVVSYYRNQDKLWADGSLGFYANFTM